MVPTPQIFAATGLDVGEDGRLLGDRQRRDHDGLGATAFFEIDPEKGVVVSVGTTLDGGPYPGFLAGLAVDPIHCDAARTRPTPRRSSSRPRTSPVERDAVGPDRRVRHGVVGHDDLRTALECRVGPGVVVRGARSMPASAGS